MEDWAGLRERMSSFEVLLLKSRFWRDTVVLVLQGLIIVLLHPHTVTWLLCGRRGMGDVRVRFRALARADKRFSSH